MVTAVALAWAAALAVPAGPARAQACPADDRTPSVAVQTRIAETEYRYDRDRNQLTAMSTQPGTSKHGRVTLGLTVPKIGTKWQIGWSTLSRGPTHCAYITKANVSLSIDSMTVYVARNYPQGSCEFGAVLVHENEHVRLYRSIMQANAPKLEDLLRQELSRMGPTLIRGSDSRPPSTERLNRVVETFVNRMYQEFERANGAIDTPENYERTHRRCQNWFSDR